MQLHGIAHDRGVAHALRAAVSGHRGGPVGEAASQRAAAGLRLGEAAGELGAAGLEAVEPEDEGAAAARRLRGAAGRLGGAAGQRARAAGQGAGAGAPPAHAGLQRAGALGERARPAGHRLRARVGLGDRRLVGGERAGELRAAAVELGGARLECWSWGVAAARPLWSCERPSATWPAAPAAVCRSPRSAASGCAAM